MGLLLETARRDAAIRASNEATGVLAARYGITTSQVSRIRTTPPRVLTNRERYQLEVVEGGWKAACMDPADWADWVRQNPLQPDGGDRAFAVRPCLDCPSAFAAEMTALGRCNGIPHTNDAKPEEDPMSPRQAKATEETILEALQRLGTRKAAAAELGIAHTQQMDTVLERLVLRDRLPEGVPDLPPRIQRLLSTPPRRITAKSMPPLIEVQGGEEPGPATAGAADEGEPATSGVATPPSPLIPTPEEALLGPCGDCVHVVVCAILADVQRVALAVELTEIPAAAHLTLTCDHFLEAAS